jgi:hypothetical protein
MKQEMNYTGPITSYQPKSGRSVNGNIIKTTKRIYSLKINREDFAKDLIKLGCPPNKSLILEFPKEDVVLKNLIRHFIRSSIEGDGSIYLTKNKKNIGVYFIGTESMVNGIKDFANQFDVNCHIFKRRKNENKNTVELSIGGNYQVLRFLDEIYRDANIFLERKYRKYYDFQKEYRQKFRTERVRWGF